MNRLFAQYHFDYLYHLAAYAAEGLSHFIKRFNYENNLIGSMNLINAAVNAGCVKCFVFTSSIAVYGSNQVPMHEDMVSSLHTVVARMGRTVVQDPKRISGVPIKGALHDHIDEPIEWHLN